MGEGVEGYDLPKFASLRWRAKELIDEGQFGKAKEILEQITDEE